VIDPPINIPELEFTGAIVIEADGFKAKENPAFRMKNGVDELGN